MLKGAAVETLLEICCEGSDELLDTAPALLDCPIILIVHFYYYRVILYLPAIKRLANA